MLGNVIDKVTQLFSKDLLDRVLFALLVTLIVKLLHTMYVNLENAWFNFKHKEFTIAGVWVARHTSSHSATEDVVEIIQIKEKKEFIHLNIQRYGSSEEESVKMYKGAGINRANKLSSYYYIESKRLSQHGIFILQLKPQAPGPDILTGQFVEYNNNDQIVSNHYTLQLWEGIPALKRACLTLRRKCFDDYNAIMQYGPIKKYIS